MQTRFKTRGESTIVVPVMINGAGPFDFMFDTGTTHTIIDSKLAAELHLPIQGKATLATLQNEAATPVARTNSISLAGAKLLGLDILVVDNFASHPPYVRGNLGEDFMRYFDLLIDNRHHILRFEIGRGLLADTLTGERLPLNLKGPSAADPTENRLIITGHCYEHSDRELTFQLDSGASTLVLLSMPRAWSTVEGASATLEGSMGADIHVTFQTAHVRLGKKLFIKTAIVPESKVSPRVADLDGLLPTSLFRSVFISHSGHFVILDPTENAPPVRNPSAKQDIAESKPPSSENSEISEGQSSPN
jgi:hypothetical protein